MMFRIPWTLPAPMATDAYLTPGKSRQLSIQEGF
ncbi:mCG140171 [Mus musculus]|nr:mCG140171 [Mus musculus]